MNIKNNKQGQKVILNSKNKRGRFNEKKNSNNKQNNNLQNNGDLIYISNINNIPQIDTKYRNELDNRMDLIMKKIDQNIKSNNYNQFNMIIHNPKINYLNNFISSIPENNESEEKDDEKIEKFTEENSEKEEENISQKMEEKGKKENASKIKDEEKDKKNEEIINKLLKRNKYLENELNYFKYKLNKVESQKEFIQEIVKNDTYIKRHLFDIFTVDFFKKIALNWKVVCDELINELIIDEIHELTEVKLKLRHNKRIEEEEEEKFNEEKKELSPIDIKEFMLFNENLSGIKQTIKSVKESERNLCKKYKVKIK